MISTGHKRSYHPMLIVLFHLDLLDHALVKQIPHSTRSYWKCHDQQDQFGYENVREFMTVNMDIRAIHQVKLIRRFVHFVCRVYNGYENVVAHLSGTQKKSKEFVEEIVGTISQLSKYVNVNHAARVMNLSTQAYYRLKNSVVCQNSKKRKCFRSLPQQLSLREIQTIDSAVSGQQNILIPKSTLYYRLLNAGKLFCSLSTFYTYAKSDLPIFRKPGPIRETLRATRLFQYLHVDIIELINSSGKHYIAFVKDNFSKAILGYRIFTKRSSGNIRELFEDVFSKHKLNEQPEQISIVCDGGSENKGELLVWIAQQVIPEVKKLTAGIDVKSNSMSESVHHILKNEFLRGKIPEDIPSAIQRFVEYHDNQRYPVEHFGYTCNEVLHGAKPDRKRFSEKIQQARPIRIEENRNFSCIKKIGCAEIVKTE